LPEGDTIYRAAKTLARALVGRPVTRFETGYAQLAAADDQAPIAGRTVEAVWSEGKHLLLRFSGPLTLRTHMRMSGSWHVYRPGEKWQRPRGEMRIVVEVGALPAPPPDDSVAREPGFVAVAFLVPVAEFLDERALLRNPALARLGPDLLGDEFDPREARARLRARPDGPMSEVLLDQSLAAGAGNVFRSEGLFLAGIDPARPASTVSDQRIEALYALVRRLLQQNVATLDRAAGELQIITYTGLRRTTGRSDPSERLWVYGRSGKPCRKCGTAIAYRKAGPDARGLYWCPRCQSG
jgi:endonuclease VIII